MVSRPARILRMVDWPVPLPPTRPVRSSGVISQLTSSKRSFWPKRLPAAESWSIDFYFLIAGRNRCSPCRRKFFFAVQGFCALSPPAIQRPQPPLAAGSLLNLLQIARQIDDSLMDLHGAIRAGSAQRQHQASPNRHLRRTVSRSLHSELEDGLDVVRWEYAAILPAQSGEIGGRSLQCTRSRPASGAVRAVAYGAIGGVHLWSGYGGSRPDWHQFYVRRWWFCEDKKNGGCKSGHKRYFYRYKFRHKRPPFADTYISPLAGDIR